MAHLRGQYPPSLTSTSAAPEIDMNTHILQDNSKLEDQKLAAVQEVWDKLEVYANSQNYNAALEKFVKALLAVLNDTPPQFIAEYPIQKLRIKCLETVLRMACHESIKNIVKDITKTMLRLVQIDNEKNAVLGLKVVCEVWKINKIYFMPEITPAVNFLKNIVKQMNNNIAVMFQVQDFTYTRQNLVPVLDDSIIESYLNQCYHTQPIAGTVRGVLPVQPDSNQYTLIPRSGVSLKVVVELHMFFVYIYQHHKQTLMAECMDFVVACLEFIQLQLPPNFKDYQGMNKASVTQGLTKEIIDDFHTAQSKMLYYITIMGKVQQFMDVLVKNCNGLINAILTMLETLDEKAVATRREILAGLKFCFTTDLKSQLMRFLPRFLDEESMLGKGYTARDSMSAIHTHINDGSILPNPKDMSLRTYLYQMVADLLHHIRFQLTFPLLLQAASIFCREMNDPKQGFQTQVMCVRLLSSICESLPKLEQQGEATRDVLWMVLDNLSYKLERIATYHLPQLVRQYGLEDANGRKITNHEMIPKEPSPTEKKEGLEELSQRNTLDFSGSPKEDGTGDGRPVDPPLPPYVKSPKHSTPEQILTHLGAIHSPLLTVTEARNFVKYLLHTVKTCCVNIKDTNKSNLSYNIEREKDIMENILKYGLICMDVFMLPFNSKEYRDQRGLQPGQGRTKEEKEAMDGFAHVFICMDCDVYREIFSKNICMLIDRININSTVQLFANAFLVSQEYVCRFGSIMIKYLMDNMDKLAVSNEKTALFVKLFKIIFSAIGCGQNVTTEGELMLKPYLSDLIRKATEYALTAKEPLNYFLLLRALFRSIGGGAHDILYGQFLPLLPNLLQFLNKLQSCNHRLQMRELFLELCLTVPVRLSSLLPYLPLLMDPLVCALNGSVSLVQQGLRTLELCVDNLQPEYLFEHMAPVRSALIQGLWRVLSTSSDNTSAQTAFRILGKFGGANRRILNNPQLLTYANEHDFKQAVITIEFARGKPSEGPPIRAEISLSEIVSVAMEQMSLLCYRIPRMMMIQPESSGNVTSLLPHSLATQQPPHYQMLKESCMELAKGLLISSLCPEPGTISPDDWKQNVIDNLKDSLKKLETATPSSYLFKGIRESERKMFINALVVLMMGVIQKDLRGRYVNFYSGIIRQLTINSLLESITPPELLGDLYRPTLCLDGAILIDAIVIVLSDTNKDFLNSAIYALQQLNDTCDVCIPDKNKLAQYPIVRYLFESICSLCYGPAWFARLGGASGLSFIVQQYPVELLRAFLLPLVESLCEVMVGLNDEISSGAIDMAVASLIRLHKRVFKDYDMDLDPNGWLETVVGIYIPIIFHPTNYVRDRMWELLSSLKDLPGPSLSDLCKRKADVIIKTKNRMVSTLQCMSMTEQEASLSSINALLEVSPSLIELNFNNGAFEPFFETVFDLCENDVLTLLSRDYYKSMDACPGHFLPPFPITTQMENLKAVAIKNLILSYKILCQDGPEGEEEKKMTFSKRVLTIAVQSALFGPERIQTAAGESLVKCAPIPQPNLNDVAGSILNSFEDPNNVDVENLLKMEKLISFNNDLWNKELAIKFVNHIDSWQISATDGFPQRTLEDINAVQAVIRLILKGDVLDFEMVSKLVNFIAFYELNYTTDTDFGWISSICELASYFPVEIVKTFCSKKFLGTYASFFCRVLSHDAAGLIRKVLKDDTAYFENLINLHTLEESQWEKFIAQDLEALNVYEESILKILDTVAIKEPDWFENNHALISRMRTIWTSPEFGDRYAVNPVYIQENDRKLVRVQTFPASKLNAPHLFGRLFVRYLKKNTENLDLLFDLMLAFDGCFATDFGFMRDFLELDLVPNRSIPWRVRAFEALLDKLEQPTGIWFKNTGISRYIQYILLPCLMYVFERYPSTEILGPGLPPNEESIPDPNHCVTRLTDIIEKSRFNFSEQNTIAMYQLCTLLAEYAPTHIHNNDCKKQGTRLRIFMVFVWTTLTGSNTTANILDPTVRFTGYLFLANLIDKFTINRRIVLQVFDTLLKQYQLDNRDLVRKALDVVTPAVPLRLQDDGYQQLLIHVKKILMEESFNMPQIQHAVSSVVRNYKVYFHVRQELIQPLLSGVQRLLHTITGNIESYNVRKLVLEVCEMAIKWDLLRNRLVEQQQSSDKDTSIEVDQELEKLQIGEKDDREEELKAIAMSSQLTTIPKDHIDTIINILLKFACSLQYQNALNPNTPAQLVQTTLDLGRKALGLLRAALKPYVWGEIAEIKYAWLEKQLTIPQELNNPRPDPTHIPVYTQHIQTAQQTLETLLALSSSMSRTFLFRVMRSLQKPLVTCLMQTWSSVKRSRDLQTHSHALVKTVNYMIGKLFEKTETVGAGIQELESLNSYLIKYLNDHFTNYYKSQTGIVQQIFTPFSVLRSICASQPCYLEGTCLQSFLKVLERAVRDQVSAHPPLDPTREKATVDFVIVALDLLKGRVGNFSSEHRRILCQNILYPLVEKTPYDKVIETLIKITHEVLITHTDINANNPALPLAQRLHVQCERKIFNTRSNRDPSLHPLMAPFLSMVLEIFSNDHLKNTEYGTRMRGSFYWGLMSADPETRKKFLAAWKEPQKPYMLLRLLHIMKDESWHHFKKYNWMRHVIWLLCQASVQQPFGFSPRKTIYFGDCTTLARTLDVMVNRDNIPSLGAMNMECAGTSFSSPGTQEEPMDTGPPPQLTPLDKLVMGQKNFLMDALEYDSSIILSKIYDMMFNMADTKFTSKIFKRLFCSIWKLLLPDEKDTFQAAIIPFLTSGIHNTHASGLSANSVLIPWMEAADMTGEIKLPPKLIHFISRNHFAWHKGLLILERDCRFLECKYAQFSQQQIRGFLEQGYGESEHTAYRETLDYLAMLYKDLEELDPYAAIWDRRAIKQDTVNAQNRIQRGEMKEALKITEDAIIHMGDWISINGNSTMTTPPIEQEYNHLYEQYAHCCEELLEWEKVRDYANHSTVENPLLLMKAAIHIPDWAMVKDCLDQLSGCIPAKKVSDFNLYMLMNHIMTPPRRDESMNPLQQGLQQNTIPSLKAAIEKRIDETIVSHIHWWRNLPPIVSNSHVKVLQAASMLREVADCLDLRVALDASGPRDYNGELINQMKHVIKVWRNRKCASSDELSMFSTVYDWRMQVHLMTLRRLEEWEGSPNVPHGTNSQNILPVHSIATGQMIVAHAAKAQKNYELAIDIMNKLHTIQAVPAMDAHMKICDHLKLIRQQAERSMDPKQQQHFYQLGLHMINEMDVTNFNADQVSKIFSIRGQFLGGLDKREEAVKAFSYATQILMEKQSNSSATDAFKAWGDQQDKILQKDQTELAAITAGAGALACFLEVARSVDSETRPKKYIGRLLWTTKQMIALGESASIRANDIIEKNERTAVSYNWLTWLPQLINDIRHRPTSAFSKILTRICEDFPLQIFYHLRCVIPPLVMDAVVKEVCLKAAPILVESLEPWIQTLLPLLKQAISLRQADCRLFHDFLSELHNMREFWAERQYRYAIFVRNEITRSINLQNIQHLPADFVLDPECINAIHMWKEDFEQCAQVNFLEESELRYLAGEVRPMVSEDVFIQELSNEIRAFFSSPCPPGEIIRYLETVICISTRLSKRLAQLPRNIPLKLSSPWLADFTNRMACIEMPKDLFHVQKTVGASSKYTSSQYTSMLARIDPFYSISIESGEPMKKISMRSINGKSSTYYLKRTVKAKPGVWECKQFLEYMNDLLTKERETSRRFLSTCTLIQLQVGYGSTLIETTASIIGENQVVSQKSPICHPNEILSKVLVHIGMQPDDAVFMFYEHLRGKIVDVPSKQQECQIRQALLIDFGEDHFIGRNNLLNYHMTTFPDPTQFYNFRKQVAKHMGVLNILEFLLRLTPPTLQEIFLSRDFGQYTVPTLGFQLPSYEVPRSVPFRLTHNFYNFLGFAADGDLRWSAESTIICMRYRQPETWLRPLLWDFVSEMIPGTFREHVLLVNKMIYDLQARIRNYDQPESTAGARLDGVDTLMRMAASNERIAMMDPSLYPWF